MVKVLLKFFIPVLLFLWTKPVLSATIYQVFPRKKELLMQVTPDEKSKFKRGDKASIFIPALTTRVIGKVLRKNNHYIVFRVRKQIHVFRPGMYVDVTKTGKVKSTKAAHFRRKGSFFKKVRFSLFGLGGATPNQTTGGMGYYFGGGGSLSFKKFELLGHYAIGYDVGFKNIEAETKEILGAVRWHGYSSFNVKLGLAMRSFDLSGKRPITQEEADANGVQPNEQGQFPTVSATYYSDEMALIFGLGSQWHFSTVTLGNSLVFGIDWIHISSLMSVSDAAADDAYLMNAYPLPDMTISIGAYGGFTI